MNNQFIANDLAFFSTLANCDSLSAAARELGISTAAVSKHLSAMERRMGLSLLSRTTRRMGLTPEGEIYRTHAQRILNDLQAVEELVRGMHGEPQGLLRVNATLGFGRSHVAPVISRFARLYPQVEVQLQLSVHPPTLTDDSFDLCIRFGKPPDARVIARHLANNQRLLVASPSYLKRHGNPIQPKDLAAHNCIGIRQGDESWGVLRLTPVRRGQSKAETIKINGNLSTNDGEIAVNWALEGHGIVMRAEWDIARYLRSGRLVQVLTDYQTPPADIYAVYPQRHHASVRLRKFVDFISADFTQSTSAK